MNITTAEKRDFLTWFLQHYRVHIPEVIILLDFLKNNDEVLESVHFVNDITRCERAMIVSTDNLDQEPFFVFLRSTWLQLILKKHFMILECIQNKRSMYKLIFLMH